MKTVKHFWLKTLSMILTLALLVSCVPNQVFAMAGEALMSAVTADDTVTLQTKPELLSAVRVVSEDTSRRGEAYKEFVLNNGLRLATVYPSAVHYEDDGEWKEIDNTLTIATSDGNIYYTNAAGRWNVRFPQNLSGSNMINITKDSFTVQFGMAGEMRSTGDLVVASIDQIGNENAAGMLSVSVAQTATAQIQELDMTAARASAKYPETVPEKLISRLTYANIYPNTNVVYDLQGNQLKESIILQQHDASLWGYRYTLNTGDLVPVLNADKQIDLCDPDTKAVVLTMPAPYMLDNNGEYSYDVDVSLVRNGSSYLLSYYLPREWLADDSRAWPVILDPVITAPGLYTNVQDRTVAETYVESNSRSTIQCGYYGPEGAMRFYMKYNTLPAMSSGDVIVDASISLYKPNPSPASANVEVHRVNGEWTSAAITWDTQPNFSDEIEDYVVCQPAGRYEWNITDIVRGWYETENTGMMFKVPDEIEDAAVDNWKQFYSSDYSYNTATMPMLTITYQNHNGLEDYWSYSTSSAGRAGTGYVNLFTGNLTWVRGDLGFDGNRMPVSINHVYNSNDAQTNQFGMGYGWRTNYNQTITLSSGIYAWEDGDGTRHYFYPAKDSEGNTIANTYLDEDSLHLTLTTGGTGDSSYQLTDQYGNKSYFNNSGYLVKLENNQETPSSISITYKAIAPHLIDTITDGAGRVYSFTYTDYLLTRINYKGTKETVAAYVSYAYTDGNLTRITDKDASFTDFTYVGHLLAEAKDVTGYSIEYTYCTDYTNRVDFVREYNNTLLGNFMSFEYSTHYTRTRDHQQYEIYYQFNDWGNLVAVHDSDGHTQYTKYALNDVGDSVPNTAEPHQIVEVFDTGGATNNILMDSSFESDFLWSTNSFATRTEISTEYAYQGEKSMKMSASTDTNKITASNCWAYAESGETYTFSAYILPENGAIVTVSLEPAGNYPGESNSLEAGTDGWIRIQVSYTNETTEQKLIVPHITVTSGTAYIDCVQLEKADSASAYSVMENGDAQKRTMDGIVSFRGWTASPDCNENDNHHVTTTGAANTSLDDGVLRIIGDPGKIKYISQTVAGPGLPGDVFVLSGWGQANAAPSGEYREPDWEEDRVEMREFGLKLVFYHIGGTSTEHYVSFDQDISGDRWQYTTATIVATAPYSTVSVQAVYSHQVNVAYFDGIQLYKDRRSTTYTYDENKNLVSETNILGQTTTYGYHDNGIDLESVTPPVGTAVSYGYDSYHNVETMVETLTVPDLTPTTTYTTTYQYTHDEYGNVTSITVTQEERAGSNTETQKEKSWISYSENKNYIASTTNSYNETTSYGYDPDTGVLLWVQYPGDTEETRTEYSYDEMYRVIGSSASIGQNTEMSVECTYHEDLLSTITTGSDTTYTITYGDFNLRKSVQVGSRTLATYHYANEDPNAPEIDRRNHNLNKLEYGNGDAVYYTYDHLGRVKSERHIKNGETGASRVIDYVYSGAGAIARMIDSATGIETICGYDGVSRIATVYETKDENFQHVVSCHYDENGNILETQESFLRFNEDPYDDVYYPILKNAIRYKYLYDYKNRLATVATDDSKKEYYYDGLDRLTEEVVSKVNGDVSTLIYSNQYTYEDITVTEDGVATEYTGSRVSKVEIDANGLQRTYEYEYDANGNITIIDSNQGTTIYVYDAANQLVEEYDEAACKSFWWTYDNAGNITSKTEIDLETGQSTTRNYGYTDATWGDLLTSYNGQPFSYDEIGNLTSDGTWTYTWQQGRQLASMSQGSTTWTYTYDANGMRTKRYQNNSIYTYVYNGTQLTAMTYPQAKLFFTYDAAGRPLTLEYHDTYDCLSHAGGSCGARCETFYYVTNLQGDVIALLDSSGNLEAEYTYDAWGNPIDIPGSYIGNLNPLRYRGYVYDRETGLYYLQSRYYNPEIGRFISADSYLSTGDGILGNNMFAYCLNNPVNYADPTGHSAILIALAIGAVLGGIYGGISAAANDQNVVAGIAIGAVVGGLTGLITEVAAVPLMLLGTFAVGAAGDVASQMILDGKSLGDVNLISVGLTGVANAGLALVGKGLSKIDSMAGLKGAEKVAFGAITNSPLLGMGMALNMVFSQNFGEYTVNDLLNDLSGPKYELAW